MEKTFTRDIEIKLEEAILNKLRSVISAKSLLISYDNSVGDLYEITLLVILKKKFLFIFKRDLLRRLLL